MRIIFVPLFCLPALLIVGCASQRADDAERESWLARRGGVVEGAPLRFAQSAAERVLQSFPRAKLRVFDSPALAAYSWPDGTVALSRGLMESLTADEIAAAVAHELGHLVNDGWLTTPAALAGSAKGLDEESKADATAVNLLEAHGGRPDALASALRKVIAAGGVSETQRSAIIARIQRLEAHQR